MTEFRGPMLALFGRVGNFARRLLPDYYLLLNSALFDQAHYENISGKSFGSRRAAVRDYVERGEKERFNPSKLFDVKEYLDRYEDLRSFEGNLLAHYLRHGVREGRVALPAPTSVGVADINRNSSDENLKLPAVDAESIMFDSLIEIFRSELFDTEFYEARVGRIFEDRQQAIYHYILDGERRGIAPSAFFDPVFYANRYPDLSSVSYTLLFHYIKYGYHEGRKASQGRPEISKQLLMEIAEGRYFDQKTYEAAVSRKFKNSEEAVAHYMTFGEAAGHRPSHHFDPVLYRNLYPDLRSYELPLLVHFARHGAGEGRLGTVDLESMIIPGRQQFFDDRPTLAIAVHEASMTGAPILGAALLRGLAGKFNLICIALRGGDLLDTVQEWSCIVIDAERGGVKYLRDRVAVPRIIADCNSRYKLSGVIGNSVETSDVVLGAAIAGIPSIGMIHEYAEYTRPKSRCADMVSYSSIVVFSSDGVRASNEESRHDGRLTNAIVAPQGKIESNLFHNDIVEVKSDALALVERLIDSGRDVVLGLGYVQPRKGVDLFFLTAQILRRRLGAKAPFFLWIGGGYRPDEDMLVSVWLQDQLKRAEIEDCAALRHPISLGQLEELYRRASCLFLSSRLDPFPNVAVDALTFGLPVVCFQRASGVAEVLETVEQAQKLVVPYLDLEAAADAIEEAVKIRRLPRSSDQVWEQLSERLSFANYLSRIEGAVEAVIAGAAAERVQEANLEKSGLLSEDMLGSERVPPGCDLSRWYVRTASTGMHSSAGQSRRGTLGFSPHVYAVHHAERKHHPDPLLDFLAAGRPIGPWQRSVVRLNEVGGAIEDAGSVSPRIALHLHLHYYDMLDEIVERLDRNIVTPDLFVSATSEEGLKYIERKLSGGRYRYEVRLTPNLGRDAASFYTEFATALSDYDIVGHIHGKKSKDISDKTATKWKEFLYEHLVGGKVNALDRILNVFREHPQVGLIFPEDPYITSWTGNKAAAREMLLRLNLGEELPEEIEFPNGNMFWARADALAPLWQSGLEWADYPPEPVAYDGTMLHALERITPIVCQARGYEWLTVHLPGCRR